MAIILLLMYVVAEKIIAQVTVIGTVLWFTAHARNCATNRARRMSGKHVQRRLPLRRREDCMQRPDNGERLHDIDGMRQCAFGKRKRSLRVAPITQRNNRAHAHFRVRMSERMDEAFGIVAALPLLRASAADAARRITLISRDLGKTDRTVELHGSAHAPYYGRFVSTSVSAGGRLRISTYDVPFRSLTVNRRPLGYRPS
jgi:hypothetical protein